MFYCSCEYGLNTANTRVDRRCNRSPRQSLKPVAAIGCRDDHVTVTYPTTCTRCIALCEFEPVITASFMMSRCNKRRCCGQSAQLLLARGVGKGGMLPPPDIPMLKKFGVSLNTLLQLLFVISILCLQLLGFRFQTQPGLCPWTPLGSSVFQTPCFAPPPPDQIRAYAPGCCNCLLQRFQQLTGCNTYV